MVCGSKRVSCRSARRALVPSAVPLSRSAELLCAESALGASSAESGGASRDLLSRRAGVWREGGARDSQGTR